MAMADGKRLNDEELEKLLAEAAEQAPLPSGQLLERIMADAEAVAAQGETPAAPPVPPAARQGRRRGRLLAALGGWPALAGLATAAVAGVWLGLAPPPGLETIARGAQLPLGGGDYGVEEFMPSLDDMLTEG